VLQTAATWTSDDSDYNLQRVIASEANDLYSEDGNFELHLPPDSVSVDGYATVLPTGYVPGPLPSGKQVIGSAYEVRLSGAVAELVKDSLVRLHYHPEVMGIYTDTLICYLDTGAQGWQSMGGEPNEVDYGLAITTNRLGIYALMGQAVITGPPIERVYLPLIVR